MSFIPKAHEIYKHFKGNLYQIVAIAQHSETGEQLVVYQALYGDFKIYARPLDMFISRVDKVKYPDAVQEFRFELQGEESSRQKEACAQPEIPMQPEAEVEEYSKQRTAAAKQSERPQGKTAEQPEQPQLKTAEQFIHLQGKSAEQNTQQHGTMTEPLVQSNCKAEQEVSCQEEEEELHLDPLVLEFLDADSYEQRLNILAAIHHRVTDDMITTMAIACDIEVGDGSTEERYDSLKNCLLTLERYECNRLR